MTAELTLKAHQAVQKARDRGMTEREQTIKGKSEIHGNKEVQRTRPVPLSQPSPRMRKESDD